MSLHSIIARALDAATGLTPYHLMPIEAARATAKKAYQKSAEPVPVGRIQNLSLQTLETEIKIRVYTPLTPGPHAGMVFFHGSGFVMLDLDTHDDICRRLCVQSNRVLVSVDYRLAPEHPFPSAPNDCLAATLKILELTESLGIKNQAIALCGDSAGACLAAVTAWRMRHSHVGAIDSLLLFYPVTDAPNTTRTSYRQFHEGYGLSESGMQWFWKHYMGAFPDHAHPHASPLQASELNGMPPTFIITAGHDVLRDEGEDYFKRLLESGIEAKYVCCENLNHGFLKYTDQIQEVDEIIQDACDWLKKN